MNPGDREGLSKSQLTVASVFFALPEAEGFLLAGGGARDFVYVHAPSGRFDRDELVRAASDRDRGFEMEVFALMLKSHRRFRDEDFPPVSMPLNEFRAYFDDWADSVIAPGGSGRP